MNLLLLIEIQKFLNKEENNWKVKIPSIRLGSFELNGKALKNDTTMEFVHSSGHFAIAKDEITMSKYLSKIIKY
jgi:hypothetical protein